MKKGFVALLIGAMLFASTGTAFAGGRHHGGGYRGWGPQSLFLGTLGVLGAIGIANAVFPPYQHYQPVYQPLPPVCWAEMSPVFDVYGRQVGSMPVQRCTQQPY